MINGAIHVQCNLIFCLYFMLSMIKNFSLFVSENLIELHCKIDFYLLIFRLCLTYQPR